MILPKEVGASNRVTEERQEQLTDGGDHALIERINPHIFFGVH
jgi:hypothetical protein